MGARCRLRLFALLCSLLPLASGGWPRLFASQPKVLYSAGTYDQCNTCEKCELGAPPEGVTLVLGENAHCNRCFGCNFVLSRLPPKEEVAGGGGLRTVFTGSSGAAVLRAERPDGPPLIAKFWCGLPPGFKQNSRALSVPQCPPARRSDGALRECKLKGGLFGESTCNFRFLNSMQHLVDDAGLAAITPRTWTASVRSFMPMDDGPSSGRKVNVEGQMYEQAEGVALEAFLGGFLSEESLRLLLSIDSEAVRLAAAFDFIFSESDRHGQNVILHPSGRMQLIDNEGTGQLALNSMFIPGTQKFETYRIGYGAVCCSNVPGLRSINCPGRIGPSAPEALLDYRCHVPGGTFGRRLPPKMAAFVARVANMSATELARHYDMTRLEHAVRLKSRVDDLGRYGFEEALARQLARQKKGDGETYGHLYSYPVPAPCCRVATCPFRLHRDYRGPLRTPEHEKLVPWVHPEYNCKRPNSTSLVWVGGPAAPPLHTWGPDFYTAPPWRHLVQEEQAGETQAPAVELQAEIEVPRAAETRGEKLRRRLEKGRE